MEWFNERGLDSNVNFCLVQEMMDERTITPNFQTLGSLAMSAEYMQQFKLLLSSK